MTAIAPNTVIRFGQVNLPKDMSDTFYFANETQQREYFQAFLTTVYTKFTYQREHRNYVKIEINSEQDADEWDYMMFQNTTYGNKWFYAFVTETEWINNLTVKIYYEIDYIQTYLFNYEEQSTWIERTHTRTDEIGDNIIPETFDLGEYVFNNPNRNTPNWDLATDPVLILMVTDSHGTIVDNMYIGGKLYALPCSEGDEQYIESIISQYTIDQDLIAAYIVPEMLTMFYEFDPSDDGRVIGNSEDSVIELALPNVSDNDTLDGYRPTNNKLYTYPYNFIYVTDNNNNEMILRYEFYTADANNKLWILMKGTILNPPTLNIYPDPAKYKKGGNVSIYRGEGVHVENIAIAGFPQAAFNYDAYAQWQGRSMVPNIIKTGAALVGGAVVGYFTGGTGASIGAAAGASAVSVASSLLSQGYSAKAEGGISKGTFSTGSSPITTRIYNVTACRASITSQYAEMIDNYFTMFGYAIKKLDVPSRYARTRFTYIKTVGCIIKGDLPTTAKKIIQDRYDNGIRFWADRENIGNYAADNPPL